MDKTFALSQNDRFFTGVCGGLAEFFGINVTVVRVFFVLATFFGFGAPILVYIALFFIMKFL